MAEQFSTRPLPGRMSDLHFDEGLRRHMLRVYNYMGLGLAVTGLVAIGVAATPTLYALIFGTPLKWVAMFAPLAFVLLLSFRIERMSASAVQIAFWAFAAVMGVSMASIFLAFTGTSIARTFLITGIMFGSVSLWGYTTKRDLAQFGTFLFMGLIGVVIASVVNLFLGSTVLQFAVSIVGVLVFTGLTAWDTQRLKLEYAAHHDHETSTKLAVFGALSLYLNFINIFQMLLSLTGQREE
jgi:FtsH-binding integral membrane protein